MEGRRAWWGGSPQQIRPCPGGLPAPDSKIHLIQNRMEQQNWPERATGWAVGVGRANPVLLPWQSTSRFLKT